MSAIEIAPIKPAVSLDVLAQLDIRVGTITTVADVADSRKLVKLMVDFGDHVRQVLVGMKQEREDPTEIEGCQALFLVNLEPMEMAGQGLSADDPTKRGVVDASSQGDRRP